MKGFVTVNVRVDKYKLVDELPELLSDIQELHGLVPEWSSLEADELAERILKRIEKLTEFKSEV